jgi:hypothetical protein
MNSRSQEDHGPSTAGRPKRPFEMNLSARVCVCEGASFTRVHARARAHTHTNFPPSCDGDTSEKNSVVA